MSGFLNSYNIQEGNREAMGNADTNHGGHEGDVIDRYEVVIVGCGMAGLSAAIASAENGADTVVLEKAPMEHRGGQTQFTGIIRFPTADVDMDLDFEDPTYTKADYLNDIMKVTNGRADSDLAETLVNNAGETFEWLVERLPENPFVGNRGEDHFVGYGAPGAWWGGDVNVLVNAAESMGVEILYDAEVRELRTDPAEKIVRGVDAFVDEKPVSFVSDAVIIAAGGFESNTEKRTRYHGKIYDDITVRGVPYNTGEAIDMALDIGAASDGNWGGAHTSMVDANAPEVGSGVGSFHGYHYGVVLNHDGERFLDEGADFRSLTYAKYGHVLLKQPYKEGFVLFDSRTNEEVAEYTAEFTEKIEGETIEELINRLDIGNAEQALATVEEYNEACDDSVAFDPDILDGKSTAGISPKKSNWAVPLHDPPFYGYPVKPGMTFSFGGLAQSTKAEVIDTRGNPIPGLFVAGNSAGGLFYYNYPGGSGQINAMVYGRIAGTEAANRSD